VFNLPEKTIYNKKIPKNKLYEKIKANTKLKNKFINQIDYILWKHKLSKQTINIEPTDEIQEMQIFEVYLKQKYLDKEVLESIDRVIPYPILYVLKYQEQAKLVIAYKERNKNDENKFVIDSYYESAWQDLNEISLHLTGLNLQAVYEQVIRGLISVDVNKNESIKITIQKQKQINSLEKEIIRLEAKVKNEKQFNKKVKLNIQLQKKKNELNKLLAK
jgi:hypothetical protein